MWTWFIAAAFAGPPFGGPGQIGPHMQGHFDSATRAAAYVAVGELEPAKAAALELDHKADMPISWQSYAAFMRRAAKRMGKSKNLPTAAERVAAIGQTCAECHTGVVGGPKLDPADTETDGVSHPGDHAVAWTWMWLGLVYSDNTPWNTGAEAMGTVPRADELGALATDWEALGKRALTAGPDGREEVFGKLIGSCVPCHAKAGVDVTGKSAEEAR